jgi:hypothetical protein
MKITFCVSIPASGRGLLIKHQFSNPFFPFLHFFLLSRLFQAYLATALLQLWPLPSKSLRFLLTCSTTPTSTPLCLYNTMRNRLSNRCIYIFAITRSPMGRTGNHCESRSHWFQGGSTGIKLRALPYARFPISPTKSQYLTLNAVIK